VIRSFIAIEIPEKQKQLLADQFNKLKREIPQPFIRWVRLEAIHLTLKFLGNLSSDRVEMVKAELKAIGEHHNPFQLSIGGFGCFPNIRRPRVLWIGIQDPTESLKKVQAEIALELAKLGFDREARAFHPHLTLGRVKRGVRREDVRGLSSQLEAVKVGSLGSFDVSSFSLISSDLRPTGAVYTRLAWVEFGGDH
jgi:2'-5' RNA ligase